MGYWARLTHGRNFIDLTSQPYDIGLDFTFPPLNRVANYTGDKRVGEDYRDRNWSVSFRILGNDELECHQAYVRLGKFLENSRDTGEKLYFEYSPYNAVNVLPIYGQGVYRWHIKDAFITMTSPWHVRDEWIAGAMNFTIGPTAEGLRQRLANAKGHIHEDSISTPSGDIRGVQVCRTLTNYCKNPVFSYEGDWDANWNTWGTTTFTAVTDTSIVPFGERVGLITAHVPTPGTSGIYQTLILDAADYMTSAYVRLTDNRTPGSTDMVFYGTKGGTAQTYSQTIYWRDQGNGWFRMSQAMPSVTAGTYNLGMKLVNNGVSAYFTGFQVEKSVNAPTPLIYGDKIGCSWASTRGSSTSAAGTSAISIPIASDTINLFTGTFRMAVRWGVDYTYATENMTLLDARDASHGTAFNFFYNITDDKFYWNYGKGTITGGTHSFAIGDVDVFYGSWGAGAGTAYATLYLNGVEMAAGIAPESTEFLVGGGSLFIGQNYVMDKALAASILDLTIWDKALPGSSILADYNLLVPWVTKGEQKYPNADDNLANPLNSVPYIWTKDGGGSVNNNCNSGTIDYAVASGIPGLLPAQTIFDISPTCSSTAPVSYMGVLLANLPYKEYVKLSDTYLGTTIASDVGTAVTEYPQGNTLQLITGLDAYRGKKAYLVTTINDAGTVDCQGAMVIHYNTEANNYISSYTALNTTAGTPQMYLLGPMVIPETTPHYIDWMRDFEELNFKMYLKRATGSGTVTLSRYRVLAGDIQYAPIFYGSERSGVRVIIDGANIYAYEVTGSKEDGYGITYGDIVQFEPGKYNNLVVLPFYVAKAFIATDNNVINRVYVIPRWSW